MTKKKEIPKMFQELSTMIYQDARSLLTSELSDEQLFTFELLELEIMGALSFAKNNKVPENARDRIKKMITGQQFIAELLSKKMPSIVRCYILLIETARVWVVEYFSASVKSP